MSMFPEIPRHVGRRAVIFRCIIKRRPLSVENNLPILVKEGWTDYQHFIHGPKFDAVKFKHNIEYLKPCQRILKVA